MRRKTAGALRRLLLALVASFGCHDIHLDYSTHSGEIVLYDDLYSISVVDSKHAVAVGYYGAAYYTSDGGDTWKQGQTNTLASLYKVSMADKLHGWAVGQRGLVLRTNDGGATWVKQPNLKEREGTHLFAVAAIDKDTAWAIGEWGTRIKTEDGGKTWVDHSFTVGETHPMFQWLSPFEQEKVRNGETVYEDVSLNDVSCLARALDAVLADRRVRLHLLLRRFRPHVAALEHRGLARDRADPARLQQDRVRREVRRRPGRLRRRHPGRGSSQRRDRVGRERS